MQIGKKKFLICLTAAFLAGGAITWAVSAALSQGAGITENKYSKLEEIYEHIDSIYYEDADPDELMDGACRGLVSGLGDEYSSYMTAEEYKGWVTNLQGEYSGIGITFTQDRNGDYVVVSVTKDSPAEAAGIEQGDILLMADGKTYDDMDMFADAIRGEEDTKLKITYMRDDSESTVEITRKNIVQQSVEYKMLDSDTALINITSFIDNTGEDFSKALAKAEEDGAKNLVLDLRDNGGGLLTSCLAVADEFLDKGPVVYVEDKQKNREAYEAEDGKTNLNTVVLVNENSASAAEILAAALQDNGFTVAGQTTFGKGVIQSTVKLEDGSALKLTVMQYFSPEGKAIHKKGVTPDVKVENRENSDTDAQLDKALELLKQQD